MTYTQIFDKQASFRKQAKGLGGLRSIGSLFSMFSKKGVPEMHFNPRPARILRRPYEGLHTTPRSLTLWDSLTLNNRQWRRRNEAIQLSNARKAWNNNRYQISRNLANQVLRNPGTRLNQTGWKVLTQPEKLRAVDVLRRDHPWKGWRADPYSVSYINQYGKSSPPLLAEPPRKGFRGMFYNVRDRVNNSEKLRRFLDSVVQYPQKAQKIMYTYTELQPKITEWLDGDENANM